MTAEFAENLLAIHQQYARKVLGKTRLSASFLTEISPWSLLTQAAWALRNWEMTRRKIADMARHMIASFATVPYVIDYLHGDRPHR